MALSVKMLYLITRREEVDYSDLVCLAEFRVFKPGLWYAIGEYINFNHLKNILPMDQMIWLNHPSLPTVMETHINIII